MDPTVRKTRLNPEFGATDSNGDRTSIEFLDIEKPLVITLEGKDATDTVNCGGIHIKPISSIEKDYS